VAVKAENWKNLDIGCKHLKNDAQCSPDCAAVRRTPAPESYQITGSVRSCKHNGTSVVGRTSFTMDSSGARTVGSRSRLTGQSGPRRRNSMLVVLAAAKPFGTWDAPRCKWTAEAHLRPNHVPPPGSRASLLSATTSSDSKDLSSGDQSPIRALVSACATAGIQLTSTIPYRELVSIKLPDSMPCRTPGDTRSLGY
jgi:hypothetical protein